MRIIPVLILSALVLSACGASGGASTPPAPPTLVTPPPPPPEPAFERRLADWAQHDPNACRALTPGFEALGGWLKNDGREPGTSRVWISDVGELSDGSSHGALVWATFTACAVRSAEGHYFTDTAARAQARMEDGRDAIYSLSGGALRPSRESRPYPTPTRLPMDFDGERDGQRVLQFQAAGNDDGLVTSMLWISSFQAALEAKDTALWVLVAGYTGTGNDRSPDPDSSICGDADPLCLFAPFEHDGTRGTSIAAPQAAAALDTVWAVWPDMDILDLRNLAFDCAEDMPAPAGEEPVTRSYSYQNGRTFTSNTNSRWGHGILSLTCLFTPNGGLQNPVTGNLISGGIYGPLAGPVAGASITGGGLHGPGFRLRVRLPGGPRKLGAGRYGELTARTGDFRSLRPDTHPRRLQRQAMGKQVSDGRFDRRRQRDRCDRRLAGRRADAPWSHGRAARRRGSADRIARVPGAGRCIGSPHRSLRQGLAARLQRTLAGRPLAHPGHPRTVAVGRRGASRIQVVRGAGETCWIA